MRKKIIFVVFCLILFLIFTTQSYGKIDPKYVVWARPNQEDLSASNGNQFWDVHLVLIPNWNGFSLFVCVKKEAPKESRTSQNLTRQEAKPETKLVEKGGKLQ